VNFVTKRKANPRKRGRKHLARGIREQVYLRWRAHFRERKAERPKPTKEQIGKEFVDRNQPWFLEVGISISDYPSLRNVLIATRRAPAHGDHAVCWPDAALFGKAAVAPLMACARRDCARAAPIRG
jgi:hypothetical protein